MRRAIRITGTALTALALATGCSSDQRQSLVTAGSSTTTTTTTITTTTTTTDFIATTAEPTAPTTAAPERLYAPVPSPSLTAERSDEFTASGPLANGQYWAVYNGTNGDMPYLSLFIVYFGEACVEAAAAFGDECLNDLFITPTPTRDLDDLPFADDALITVADAGGGQSYRIDPGELIAASTGTPSAAAPEGFQYIPFAYLMTVLDGEIVAFEQFRTP